MLTTLNGILKPGRMAVLLFLLLNALLTTAQFAQAEPITFSTTSSCLAGPQQDMDLDENHLLPHQRQVRKEAITHKKQAGLFLDASCVENCRPATYKKTALAYLARSAYVARLNYYEHLSLFHLF